MSTPYTTVVVTSTRTMVMSRLDLCQEHADELNPVDTGDLDE